MYPILQKQILGPTVKLVVVQAPLVAGRAKAGQFVIVRMNEYGERIPLTIADFDSTAGTITLIFQAVGGTTRKLALKSAGDTIENLLVPLGQPTHIKNYGRVVCVGGGIGVAPLYPIAQALKEAGNHVTVILGARNRDLVILEKPMLAIADQLILCTDDGSAGQKALVTAPLKALCEGPQKPDFAVAIGPPIMMKFCAETTRPFGVPTFCSLNSIMVDGTGMCGGCRVTVGGEMKFVCVDGPEFNAHLVDFDNMMLRSKAYRAQEQTDHDCFILQYGVQK